MMKTFKTLSNGQTSRLYEQIEEAQRALCFLLNPAVHAVSSEERMINSYLEEPDSAGLFSQRDAMKDKIIDELDFYIA